MLSRREYAELVDLDSLDREQNDEEYNRALSLYLRMSELQEHRYRAELALARP